MSNYKRNAYGYCGHYKDCYLKSSLEYIYVRYLESLSITWQYEPRQFILSDGVGYKPDFLLADGTYVEIKGDFNYWQDLPKIKRFEKEFGYTIFLLTEPDLRKLLRTTNLRFDVLRKEWKETATLHMKRDGENNPRYGVACSDQTKKKIGLKALARMADPEYKKKWLKGALSWSRKGINRGHRVARIQKNCQRCGTLFEVAPYQQKRIYCSQQCNCEAMSQKGADAEKKKREPINSQIKEIAIAFAKENQDQILTAHFNRISVLLDPMFKQIEKEVGVKDKRTISKAIVGKPSSRKEMLRYLQSFIENVRGTIANEEAIELGDKKPLG